MEQRYGYVERLGDLLMKYPQSEKQFWSDLRPTGYSGLDEQLGGWRPGELTILASQHDWILPELNLQMIEAVAIKEMRPVLFIQVGTSIRHVVGTWLNRTQAYPWWRRTQNNEADLDESKLHDVAEAPIFLLDAHGYCINKLTQRIDAFAQADEGMGLIVIDGIDRLDIWEGMPDASLAARWASVSGALKSIAMRHRCPVIVNSGMQIYEKDETPIETALLRHLPHEGALAIAADQVLVLGTSDNMVSGEPVDLYSVYSRHQLLCSVQLRFDHKTGRWDEVAR